MAQKKNTNVQCSSKICINFRLRSVFNAVQKHSFPLMSFVLLTTDFKNGNMFLHKKHQKFPIWYQGYQRLSKSLLRNPVFMRVFGFQSSVRFPLSALLTYPRTRWFYWLFANSQFSKKPFWYQLWYQSIWTYFVTIFILSARCHRKLRYRTNNFCFSVNTSSVSVIMIFGAINICMPHLTYDKSLVYVVVK